MFFKLRTLDQQIDTLRKDIASWQKPVEKAQQVVKDVQQLDNFRKADVNWLEELRELSDEMPAAEDAIVRQWSAVAVPNGGGKMGMEVDARSPAVVAQAQTNLRDDRHHVYGKGSKEDPQAEPYRWRFDQSIEIESEDDVMLPAEHEGPQ